MTLHRGPERNNPCVFYYPSEVLMGTMRAHQLEEDRYQGLVLGMGRRKTWLRCLPHTYFVIVDQGGGRGLREVYGREQWLGYEERLAVTGRSQIEYQRNLMQVYREPESQHFFPKNPNGIGGHKRGIDGDSLMRPK